MSPSQHSPLHNSNYQQLFEPLPTDMVPGQVTPKPNGVWSRSEIKTMKSLIRRHNNDVNNNGKDIVDLLQERFHYKEKHQVTDLYLDIVTEMMQTLQLQQGSGTASNINNPPPPVEEPAAMDNAAVAVVPQPGPAWYPARRRLWTHHEHMLFLSGLRLYGRGNWRHISMLIETRTPLEVSIHAQKFFRKLGKAARTQRSSVNAKPCSQNPSKGKALATTDGGYNLGDSQSSSQLAAMNTQAKVSSPFMYHVDQASNSGGSSQAAWTGDQQNFVPDELLEVFAQKL